MDTEGLSFRYRFTWRIRYVLVNVFGPAELGEHDPRTELRRERAAKAARARRGR